MSNTDIANADRSGGVVIEGYKAAYIVCTLGGDGEVSAVKFASGVWPTRYGQSAEAVCGGGGTHVPPDAACTCGWHMLRSADAIIAGEYSGAYAFGDSGVLLKVRLSGDVVEGVYGWRGSVQHVQTAYLSPFCEQAGCGRRATAAAVGEVIEVDSQMCDELIQWQRWRTVESRCETHTSDARRISYADLTGMLECEVEIGDPAQWDYPLWAWMLGGQEAGWGGLRKPSYGTRMMGDMLEVVIGAGILALLVTLLVMVWGAERMDAVQWLYVGAMLIALNGLLLGTVRGVVTRRWGRQQGKLLRSERPWVAGLWVLQGIVLLMSVLV